MQLIKTSITTIKLLVLTLFLFSGKTLKAQNNSKLLDSTITTGVLKNGMTYYIKHNVEPKDRVSFYFAQNVGSVLENEKQRGLAHFLEHMAFNGTEHFKDKGMLDYLKKNGIAFGSEINASTGFDRTIYNINHVPTSNEKLLDSVLLILHDWSGSLLLKDEEIDKERGVVNEEWRMRNTPAQRAGLKVFKEGVVKGSIYENRMPIGLMSVINNFKYQELRDYYKKWYRPDLQSVIVVGDIAPTEMEQKIINTFSSIPMPEHPAKRPVFEVPLNDDLIYIQSVDKELTRGTIHYLIKFKKEDNNPVTFIDDKLISGLALSIYNSRIRELLTAENSPAHSITLSYENHVRPLDALTLTIKPKKDKAEAAFEFALTELARYAKYGPLDTELERSKKSKISSYAMTLSNLNKVSSNAYAKRIYEYKLEGTPFPNYEWYGTQVVQSLPKYTKEDVLNYLSKKFKYQNCLFGLTGATNTYYTTEDSVKSIIKKVQNASLEPYKEIENNDPLVTDDLTGSEVANTFEVPGLNAKGYQLENGARIILYPTDNANENIRFKIYSKGGKSLVNADLLPDASMVTQMAYQSGLGEFDSNALNKKLAGTNQRFYYLFNETEEGFYGRTAKRDFETLMKRVYLAFVHPRFDESEFESSIKSWRQNNANKYNNKHTRYNEAMSLANTNNSERTIIYNDSIIKNITLHNIKQIYKERFSNVGDFTFVFVGDIDTETMLEHLKTYIGSIPSTGKQETYRDHNLIPAEGKTQVHIQEKLETPQTSVKILFEDYVDIDVRKELILNIAGQLLSSRYLEEIRENEGGSYSVGAWGYARHTPKEKYIFQVKFNCNPDMTDKLVDIVYNEFKTLETTVNENTLIEAKKSLIKKRMESENDNSFWLNQIVEQDTYGLDIVSKKDYIDLVNSISADDIKALMKDVNKNARVIQAILEPDTIDTNQSINKMEEIKQ
ncbi:M16 family metallopeptidase [Formosa sp. S-31]|uniref:M16 family metallopeptidase n=1 Tax=Formosa sp. S-31 TaxID=2790949 RepID=UPI003EBBF9C5